MANKRLDENEKKINKTIRLPKWIYDELSKRGKITQIIEQILIDFLKNDKKRKD